MDQLISFSDSTYVYVGDPIIISKKFMNLVHNRIINLNIIDNVCEIKTTEEEIKINLEQLNGLESRGIEFCFNSSLKVDCRIELIKRLNKPGSKDFLTINREEQLGYLLLNLDTTVEFLMRILNISLEDIEQTIVTVLNKKIKFYSDLSEIVEKIKEEKKEKEKDLIESNNIDETINNLLKEDELENELENELEEEKTQEMKELEEFLQKNNIILIKDIDLDNSFNLFRKYDTTIKKIIKSYFDRVGKLYTAIKIK